MYVSKVWESVWPEGVGSDSYLLLLNYLLVLRSDLRFLKFFYILKKIFTRYETIAHYRKESNSILIYKILDGESVD